MSDGTKIEWTEATWNPITGCSVATPGCTNCYAMKLAGTRLRDHPSRKGLTRMTRPGPVWTGEVRFNEQWLTQPLQWKRPRMIFVCAHGDLFHESVPDEWIDRVFAVMALAPRHTFEVLTKRARRMREYLSRRGASPSLPSHEIMAAMDGISRAKWPDLQWPLPNVWLGVSVEDQTRADERIPDLLATPAAVRWLACEPLLGPVDLERITFPESHYEDWLRGEAWDDVNGLLNQEIWGADQGPKLDWIVAGGESGPGARPLHPDWARSLRDQCAAAGVPFFFKQWGEWGSYCGEPAGRPGQFAAHHTETDRWSFYDESPRQFWIFGADCVRKRVGKKAAGRLLDGVQHDGMPEVARA